MTHSALKHLDYHNWANQRVLTHLKSLPEEPVHPGNQKRFSNCI